MAVSQSLFTERPDLPQALQCIHLIALGVN